jgi:hypothetical protein
MRILKRVRKRYKRINFLTISKIHALQAGAGEGEHKRKEIEQM